MSIRHSPRVIGQSNCDVLDALSDTYAAALRLAEMGFSILMIELEPSRSPQIYIRDPGPRLKMLTDEASVREKRRERTARDRMFITVRWETAE